MSYQERNERRIKIALHTRRVINNNGCWLWTGATTKRIQGYGVIRVDNHNELVHRLSFKLFSKDFNPILDVLHKCNNTKCYNPDHLYQGSHSSNMIDRYKDGLDNNVQRQRTHCPQGHPYTDGNTYVTKNGWRQCKICKKERNNI